MVAVPTNEVTAQDVADWYALCEQIAKLKPAEMLLRNKIFKGTFPNPVEGTNTVPFVNNWVIKGVYKIDRKLDVPMYNTIQADCRAMGFNPDLLVERKPTLVLTAYRQLTAEQQKFFDQALVSKPATPSLEVVKPAERGGKASVTGVYAEQSDTGQ